MTRFIAALLVVFMAAASGRLLACDYSCLDHTRAEHSAQPSCHEEAEDDVDPVARAGQNDCDEQPALIAGFLAGKISSLLKPALAAFHATASPLTSTVFAHIGQPRVPDGAPVFHRFTPLRI